MVNSISSKQNHPKQLNCLAAQRTLYSIAKKITVFQIFLSVPLIIVFSIVTLALNNNTWAQFFGYQQVDISWVVAVVGVTVAIIDSLVLSQLINKYKGKAAKIQELFDISVFEIPWNAVAVGDKPDYEEISNYSARMRGKQEAFLKLEDWYSNKLDGIPLSAATNICQRSNLRWDADLRNNFSIFMIILTLLLTLVLLFIGLYEDLTLKRFFLVILFPSLPIILITIRQLSENKIAINQLTTLKELLDNTWHELLTKNKSDIYLFENSRKIQDQIYLNRKSNPLIFDWIYNRSEPSQHEDMYYSINQMIDEYEQASQTQQSHPH